MYVNGCQPADFWLSVTVSLLTKAVSLLTDVCQWPSACWRIAVSLLTDVCQLLYNLLTYICKPADRRLSVAISLLTNICQPADWCLSVSFLTDSCQPADWCMSVSFLTDICQPADWYLSVGKRRPCFVWLGHKAVPPLYRLYTCWFFSWQTIRVVKGTFTQIKDK
jgi:hypothetical protein